MRKRLSLAVLLAAPALLAACDAADPAAPSDNPLALQIAIDQGGHAFDVRCGGEDAAAQRAAAELARTDGGAVLSITLAVSQQRGTVREDCEAHVLVPLRAGALAPGTYEIVSNDRAFLSYVREERGRRTAYRFGDLTGRLRLDRVSDGTVAGFLTVRAVTDRGTASASANFRAALSR